MNISLIVDHSQYFLSGLMITLMLSGLSVVIGTLVGTCLALVRLYARQSLKMIVSMYVSFIRGTPLMIQLMIIYYGLPFNIDMFHAGVIAMSINSSAYIAEILRAGISSIDKGQTEGYRALGMTELQGIRYVIIPQAIKNILPALGNEFVVLIKESAIVSVIGVHDLMYNAEIVRSVSYDPFTPLVAVALIYFLVTSVLSACIRHLERRLKVSDRVS